MTQINKILFATDFSHAAENAFALADQFARKCNAELHVLHVVQWSGIHWFSRSEYALPEGDQIQIIEKYAREAQEMMDEKYPRDKFITHVAERSDSHADQAIVDYASDNNIDLIVMGARGGGKILRKLLGGTVEHVIEMSPCPVLVSRGDKHQSVPRNILVAVDFADHTENLLKGATWLANTVEARLDILHVIPPSFLGTLYVGLDGTPISLDEIRKANLNRLEELADRVIPETVPSAVHISEGDPSFEVAECIKRCQSDLLVVSTHAYTGLKRLLLGSTARRIIRDVPCSVFVFKIPDN